MTTVRSFSFLIVSFHTFYKGMCILAYVLKEGKKKRKEKKKGRKEKRKRKRWAVLKTVPSPQKNK